MKILIIHNHYLYSGGEDVVVRSEMKMLQDQGHEVVLFERANKEFYHMSLLKKIIFVTKEIFWSSGVYREVRHLIRKEKPDCAHIHNTLFIISPSVYDACFDERLPVVQTLHNYRFICPNGVLYRDQKVCEDCIGTRRFNSVFHKCIRGSYFASLLYLGVWNMYQIRRTFKRKINLFIALSEFSRDKFLKSDVIEGKEIVVKPNFLVFDPHPREHIGHYVLYVGLINSYKGLHTLMRAWEKVNGIKLKVIGDGPLYEKLREEKSAESRIEFLGALSFDKTIRYIQNSAFVVVPSECYETFSRVIVESFACGVPVVASDIGALKERVRDHVTGLLFESQNADDLADKVLFLHEHKEVLVEMGKEARKEFDRKYTVGENYKTLINIYKRCLR